MTRSLCVAKQLHRSSCRMECTGEAALPAKSVINNRHGLINTRHELFNKCNDSRVDDVTMTSSAGNQTRQGMYRIMILIILVTMQLPATLAQVTWRMRPTDKSVTLGGRVHFNCSFRGLDSANHVIAWMSVQEPIVLFNNDQRFRAPAHLRVERVVFDDVVGYSLIIDSAKKEDGKQYKCDLNKPGFSGAANLAVNVGPGIPTFVASKPNSALVENDYVRLNCSSSGGHPRPTLTWRRDGKVINGGEIEETKPLDKYGVTSSSLTIRLNRSDHRASFSCAAFNSVNRASPALSTYVITVRYKPGPATIEVPKMTLKGNNATLNCRVLDAGNPAGRIVWHKVDSNQELLGEGQTLTLRKVTLADNGFYSCRARNSLGDGLPSTRELRIYEKPYFVSGLPSRRDVTTKDSNFEQSCTARGKPSPTVTWLKDGVELRPERGLFTVTSVRRNVSNTQEVTSTLSWRGSARRPTTDKMAAEDNGNYSCVLSTTLAADRPATVMRLVVQYAPSVKSISEKVAVDVNQSASLVCLSEGIPAPRISWFNGSTAINSGGRISIKEDRTAGGVNSIRSLLTISSVQQRDLGSYKCTSSNTIGDATSSIKLSVKTVPNAPENVRIITRTWESLQVSWSPGFDGGHPQRLTLSYASMGEPLTTVEIKASKINRYNLTGLYPNTSYVIQMFGQNLLGRGKNSNKVTTKTQHFVIPAPKQVFYRMETRTLTFQSPSTRYCAKVNILTNEVWSLYAECAPTAGDIINNATGGSIKVKNGITVTDIQVSFCLFARQEICSHNTSALMVHPASQDLPASTIIIVACVCGVVVVSLLLVLAILCFRRYRPRQKPSETTRSVTSNGKVLNGNGILNNGVNGRGIDNKGMEYHEQNGGGTVLTSQYTSDQQHYNMQLLAPSQTVTYRDPPPAYNGHSTHVSDPPVWNNNVQRQNSQLNKYTQQNHLNDHRITRNTAKIPYSKTSDESLYPYKQPYGRESVNGSDSGVSTPDPVKPRKVIHEVVV